MIVDLPSGRFTGIRAAAEEMRRLSWSGRKIAVVRELAVGKGGDRQRVREPRCWRQACAGALIPPTTTTAFRAGPRSEPDASYHVDQLRGCQPWPAFLTSLISAV
jgi:hypothetical protein